MSGSPNERCSGTILKLGGLKPLGFKWQWRTCIIQDDCKLRYINPKNHEVRGFLQLEGSICQKVSEKDKIYSKLIKNKFPKPPEGINPIERFSFLSLKPKDNQKTYYFAVPYNELDKWYNYFIASSKGKQHLKQNSLSAEGMPMLLIHSSDSLTLDNCHIEKPCINETHSINCQAPSIIKPASLKDPWKGKASPDIDKSLLPDSNSPQQNENVIIDMYDEDLPPPPMDNDYEDAEFNEYNYIDQSNEMIEGNNGMAIEI